MKRPIKFRAFCSATKQMINPYCELKPSGRFWGEDMTNTPYDVKADDVMQFTGLTDKNGREIYEGDIVLKEGNPEITKASYLNRKYVVEFNTDYAEFRFSPLIPMVDGQVFIPRVRYEIEVIGNIYENPELLTA